MKRKSRQGQVIEDERCGAAVAGSITCVQLICGSSARDATADVGAFERLHAIGSAPRLAPFDSGAFETVCDRLLF